MTKLLLSLILTASASGCATAPQAFLGGLQHGARAWAGAVSPDVYAAQRGLPPPRRMMRQQTDCRPDFLGGFTCVTSDL